jgi:hypothetical protein
LIQEDLQHEQARLLDESVEKIVSVLFSRAEKISLFGSYAHKALMAFIYAQGKRIAVGGLFWTAFTLPPDIQMDFKIAFHQRFIQDMMPCRLLPG